MKKYAMHSIFNRNAFVMLLKNILFNVKTCTITYAFQEITILWQVCDRIILRITVIER